MCYPCLCLCLVPMPTPPLLLYQPRKRFASAVHTLPHTNTYHTLTCTYISMLANLILRSLKFLHWLRCRRHDASLPNKTLQRVRRRRHRLNACAMRSSSALPSLALALASALGRKRYADSAAQTPTLFAKMVRWGNHTHTYTAAPTGRPK